MTVQESDAREGIALAVDQYPENLSSCLSTCADESGGKD